MRISFLLAIVTLMMFNSERGLSLNSQSFTQEKLDVADSIIEFSDRIFELSEFLVNVLDIKLHDKGLPIKVTWHSSCHSLREMNVIEYSKILIRQLENVELIELEKE